MRFALRHADRVIANSEHTRDTLLHMGIDPKRITIIYPGVDTSVFRPGLDTTGLREGLNISPEEKLVFSVGRLSRRKGFDQMLRAVAQLKASGLPVRYVIGGIGEDAEYLKGIIQELDLENTAHLIGPISEADLPRWLNACDVFAMPNRPINGDDEGFGMVFIEAAACGKTSLAGKSGGTGSAVLHEVTGLRVEGESVEAITSSLSLLLNDDELRARLSDNAFRRVQDLFSWEKVAFSTGR
jgi:phosphatidylinositol alpha-1,6-mannosyltransferase